MGKHIVFEFKNPEVSEDVKSGVLGYCQVPECEAMLIDALSNMIEYMVLNHHPTLSVTVNLDTLELIEGSGSRYITKSILEGEYGVLMLYDERLKLRNNDEYLQALCDYKDVVLVSILKLKIYKRREMLQEYYSHTHTASDEDDVYKEIDRITKYNREYLMNLLDEAFI